MYSPDDAAYGGRMTSNLDEAVARWAAKGWTVSSVNSAQAILQRKKKLNWLLHLVLAVLTGGFWLIVVAILVINRRIETKVLRVDRNGRILET
jgi:hypothetical protein